MAVKFSDILDLFEKNLSLARTIQIDYEGEELSDELKLDLAAGNGQIWDVETAYRNAHEQAAIWLDQLETYEKEFGQ